MVAITLNEKNFWSVPSRVMIVYAFLLPSENEIQKVGSSTLFLFSIEK